MTKTKQEPNIGSIPENKTPYFYVFSCMVTHQFTVKETTWIDGISDMLRLAKGNVFLTNREAQQVCFALNERLFKISSLINNQHQKQRIEQDAARRKEEEEKRKAERKKIKYSTMQLADIYEKNKKKREKKKKSAHPDIIA